MAHYVRRLRTTASSEQAFAHVAEFTNAVWDPSTLASVKTTDGPVGVGTRFILTAKAPFGSFEMPYTITAYEPPSRLVLEGENRTMAWVDVITFEPSDGGALVDYDATFTLKGILRVGDVLFRPMFKRIGDDATDGLVAALDGITQA